MQENQKKDFFPLPTHSYSTQANMKYVLYFLELLLPWIVRRLEKTDRSDMFLGHDWILSMSESGDNVFQEVKPDCKH